MNVAFVAALVLLAAPRPDLAQLAFTERARIVEAVLDAQRANVERADADAYFAVFAPDARWIHARGTEVKSAEKPLTSREVRERLELRQSLKLTGWIGFSHVDLRADGESLVLTAEAELRGGGYGRIEHDEFRLEPAETPLGWAVVEHRYWPLAELIDGQWVAFDKPRWKAIDKGYKDARYRAPTSPEQIRGLIAARRIIEARTVAEAGLGRRPGDDETRRLLAWTCYELGEVERARDVLVALRDREAALPTDLTLRP